MKLASLFLALAVTLIDWVQPSYAAESDPDLSGSWTCEGQCQSKDGKPKIVQSGKDLECWNEVDQLSKGSLYSASRITCWDGGSLLPGAKVILWSDGHRWVR
jgi:hypothetical protein